MTSFRDVRLSGPTGRHLSATVRVGQDVMHKDKGNHRVGPEMVSFSPSSVQNTSLGSSSVLWRTPVWLQKKPNWTVTGLVTRVIPTPTVMGNTFQLQ